MLLMMMLLLFLERSYRGGDCGGGGRAGHCGDGGGGCLLAATGPGHRGRDRGRMLWPLPGVVQSERLDEVIVNGRAVRARHFATVVAVEVQSLVRHHQRFLAAVALWAHGQKTHIG